MRSMSACSSFFYFFLSFFLTAGQFESEERESRLGLSENVELRETSPEFLEQQARGPQFSERLIEVEQILDRWSDNLKAGVLAELTRWQLSFIQRKHEKMQREREQEKLGIRRLESELASQREMLQSYEASGQHKDETISNLSRCLQQQKEKVDKMRHFTKWRLQHIGHQQEGWTTKLAMQHHRRTLLRHFMAVWRALIQNRWQEHISEACQARAREVCLQLGADYEARIATMVQEQQVLQTEVTRLLNEREQYEGTMKKAFMRGVCALNLEALNIFQENDNGPESSVPGTLEPHPHLSTQDPRASHPPRESHDDDEIACQLERVSQQSAVRPLHGLVPCSRGTSAQAEAPRPTAVSITATRPEFSRTLPGHTRTSRPGPQQVVGSRFARHRVSEAVVENPCTTSVLVERHQPNLRASYAWPHSATSGYGRKARWLQESH
uniref:Centrosomal protein POC5 n=1 Tax=Eptatretus burgeri TaxID=7764 RepID=A0A8C4N5Y3_EPTBU